MLKKSKNCLLFTFQWGYYLKCLLIRFVCQVSQVVYQTKIEFLASVYFVLFSASSIIRAKLFQNIGRYPQFHKSALKISFSVESKNTRSTISMGILLKNESFSSTTATACFYLIHNTYTNIYDTWHWTRQKNK